MLQYDGHCGKNAALSRRRPLDDADSSILENTSKRQCLDHDTLEKFEVVNVESKTIRMDVAMDEVDTASGCTSNPITTMPPDEILTQMVQSGCYSQEEVVNFCISSGIPLSRMLRLDLMRLSR